MPPLLPESNCLLYRKTFLHCHLSLVLLADLTIIASFVTSFHFISLKQHRQTVVVFQSVEFMISDTAVCTAHVNHHDFVAKGLKYT